MYWIKIIFSQVSNHANYNLFITYYILISYFRMLSEIIYVYIIYKYYVKNNIGNVRVAHIRLILLLMVMINSGQNFF